jgi:hypothetical protein
MPTYSTLHKTNLTSQISVGILCNSSHYQQKSSVCLREDWLSVSITRIYSHESLKAAFLSSRHCHFIISIGIQFMDHLRIMGFLVLLFTTLSALQFAEARVLEHQFHNAALSQHNSAVDFDSDLDAVAVASSRQNYSGPGGHVANYSESNTGSNSEISTHAANNTIITVELLQKEATPGDGSSSKAPARIKEVAPIEGNADILHEMLNSHSSPGVGHMSVHGGVEGNVLSSSGKSPGVGHWEKSKTKYSTSLARTTPNNVLSSGPSPGVGNAHTSAIAGTQSELGTFNKLPSGSSPGVGHKVTDGYTEMGQDLESKKSASAMMMNILPSGPSPGGGNSATNGRNMMEKISIESESSKKTARARESESKSKSAIMMNILSSGPSPGVGNSATNGRNMMEKMSKEDEEGMGIQTFNRLPSGPSPGVGHSYTNAHQPEKLQTVSEDTKGSDHIPIFHKLPGGPSPGGGHSYVQKSASPARTTPNNVFSGPSPGVGNAHTSAIAGTQSELGTFNKLPSGPSPGVGHKVTKWLHRDGPRFGIKEKRNDDEYTALWAKSRRRQFSYQRAKYDGEDQYRIRIEQENRNAPKSQNRRRKAQ